LADGFEGEGDGSVSRGLDDVGVEGAGQASTMTRIVLPLITPGLVVAIICIILSCNEFLFALVITYRPATQTLPVDIALIQSNRLCSFEQMSAASLTGMISV
jgi:multiple sugar transport system permease protein